MFKLMGHFQIYLTYPLKVKKKKKKMISPLFPHVFPIIASLKKTNYNRSLGDSERINKYVIRESEKKYQIPLFVHNF